MIREGMWLAELRHQNGRELMVPPTFLESFDIAKLLLFFPGWFRELLDYLLSWLWGVYHWLVVLFQVLLTGSSF